MVLDQEDVKRELGITYCEVSEEGLDLGYTVNKDQLERDKSGNPLVLPDGKKLVGYKNKTYYLDNRGYWRPRNFEWVDPISGSISDRAVKGWTFVKRNWKPRAVPVYAYDNRRLDRKTKKEKRDEAIKRADDSLDRDEEPQSWNDQIIVGRHSRIPKPKWVKPEKKKKVKIYYDLVSCRVDFLEPKDLSALDMWYGAWLSELPLKHVPPCNGCGICLSLGLRTSKGKCIPGRYHCKTLLDRIITHDLQCDDFCNSHLTQVVEVHRRYVSRVKGEMVCYDLEGYIDAMRSKGVAPYLNSHTSFHFNYWACPKQVEAFVKQRTFKADWQPYLPKEKGKRAIRDKRDWNRLLFAVDCLKDLQLSSRNLDYVSVSKLRTNRELSRKLGRKWDWLFGKERYTYRDGSVELEGSLTLTAPLAIFVFMILDQEEPRPLPRHIVHSSPIVRARILKLWKLSGCADWSESECKFVKGLTWGRSGPELKSDHERRTYERLNLPGEVPEYRINNVNWDAIKEKEDQKPSHDQPKEIKVDYPSNCWDSPVEMGGLILVKDEDWDEYQTYGRLKRKKIVDPEGWQSWNRPINSRSLKWKKIHEQEAKVRQEEIQAQRSEYDTLILQERIVRDTTKQPLEVVERLDMQSQNFRWEDCRDKMVAHAKQLETDGFKKEAEVIRQVLNKNDPKEIVSWYKANMEKITIFNLLPRTVEVMEGLQKALQDMSKDGVNWTDFVQFFSLLGAIATSTSVANRVCAVAAFVGYGFQRYTVLIPWIQNIACGGMMAQDGFDVSEIFVAFFPVLSSIWQLIFGKFELSKVWDMMSKSQSAAVGFEKTLYAMVGFCAKVLPTRIGDILKLLRSPQYNDLEQLLLDLSKFQFPTKEAGEVPLVGWFTNRKRTLKAIDDHDSVAEAALRFEKRATEIYHVCSVSMSASPLMSNINGINTFMSQCASRAANRLQLSAGRPYPMWVALVGDPGSGKSVIESFLALNLYRAFKPDHTNADIYTGSEDGWMDSYTGQEVDSRDDLFQSTNKEDMRKVALHFIHAVNSSPYLPQMADPGKKGTVYESQFIVSSSNCIRPMDADKLDITNADALYRRRALVAHIKLDPKKKREIERANVMGQHRPLNPEDITVTLQRAITGQDFVTMTGTEFILLVKEGLENFCDVCSDARLAPKNRAYHPDKTVSPFFSAFYFLTHTDRIEVKDWNDSMFAGPVTPETILAWWQKKPGITSEDPNIREGPWFDVCLRYEQWKLTAMGGSYDTIEQYAKISHERKSFYVWHKNEYGMPELSPWLVPQNGEYKYAVVYETANWMTKIHGGIQLVNAFRWGLPQDSPLIGHYKDDHDLLIALTVVLGQQEAMGIMAELSRVNPAPDGEEEPLWYLTILKGIQQIADKFWRGLKEFADSAKTRLLEFLPIAREGWISWLVAVGVGAGAFVGLYMLVKLVCMPICYLTQDPPGKGKIGGAYWDPVIGVNQLGLGSYVVINLPEFQGKYLLCPDEEDRGKSMGLCYGQLFPADSYKMVYDICRTYIEGIRPPELDKRTGMYWIGTCDFELWRAKIINELSDHPVDRKKVRSILDMLEELIFAPADEYFTEETRDCITYCCHKLIDSLNIDMDPQSYHLRLKKITRTHGKRRDRADPKRRNSNLVAQGLSNSYKGNCFHASTGGKLSSKIFMLRDNLAIGNRHACHVSGKIKLQNMLTGETHSNTVAIGECPQADLVWIHFAKPVPGVKKVPLMTQKEVYSVVERQAQVFRFDGDYWLRVKRLQGPYQMVYRDRVGSTPISSMTIICEPEGRDSNVGNCGLPYSVDDDFKNLHGFIGIHSAGGKGVCGFVPVWSEMVPVRLNMQSDLYDYRRLMPPSAFEVPSDARFHNPTRTSLVRTPVYFEMEKRFGKLVAPAKLTPVNVDGRKTSPLYEAEKKIRLDLAQPSLPEADYDLLLKSVFPTGKFPCDVNVACAGGEMLTDYGPVQIDPMELNTSSGWPYCLLSPAIKKKDLFTDHLPDVVKIKEALARCLKRPGVVAVYERIGAMGVVDRFMTEPSIKNWMLIPPVFVATLKDEKRDIERVKLAKTRLFYMPSIQFVVLGKYLWSAYMSYIKSMFVQTGYASGINPCSFDWYLLYQRFVNDPNFPNKVFGDYSNYDQSLVLAACEVVMKFLKELPGDSELAEFYSNCLLYNRPTMVDDRLYFVDGGNPSGQFITSLFNSMANIVLLFSCYMYYYPDATVGSWLEFNRVLAGGDDHIWAQHESVQITMLDVADYMKEQFGMKYTAADKGDIEMEFGTAEDVTFLKRKWRVDSIGGLYAWPEIDRLSIIGPLMYCAKTADFREVLDGCIREISLLPDADYAKWMEFVRFLNAKYQLDMKPEQLAGYRAYYVQALRGNVSSPKQFVASEQTDEQF